MGVFLGQFVDSGLLLGLPHARGGVSNQRLSLCCNAPSSPRPWGCYTAFDKDPAHELVFPTPVGVFLASRTTGSTGDSLSHARGGVSEKTAAFFVAA